MHISEMGKTEYSVITAHAELEGMAYFDWFDGFLARVKSEGAEFFALADYAEKIRNNPAMHRTAEIVMSPFTGRSGTLAVQREKK